MLNSGDIQLLGATKQHILEVKTWFTSNAEIVTWGGPNMCYPMADAEYLMQLCAAHLHSYILTNSHKQILAFGQFYVRLGRHHLGRLVVNPANRGQGLARQLIAGLLSEAERQQDAQGASLFVFESNRLALQLYLALGFTVTAYPEAMPGNLQDCLYMIRDRHSLGA